MASPEQPDPPPPPSRHAALTPAAAGASNAGPLTLDALGEVLLRLSAKELCRLRVVCRPWLALLSDPHFAAAHAAAAYPRDPLFVASHPPDGAGPVVDLLDMSGKVLKRVCGWEGDVVTGMADLVCVKGIGSNGIRLLNPATRAMYHLAHTLAEGHLARGVKLCDYGEPVHVVGKVASTGEYKVLRMHPNQCRGDNRKDLFEVGTVDHGKLVKWRGTQGPPEPFVWNEWTRVVIGGVVYFLTVDAYFAALKRQVTEQSWIVSFDLEAEEWGPGIKGPNIVVDDVRVNNYHGPLSKQVTLANLNKCLVIVHGPTPFMDIWFLVDAKKGLWVKKYSVQVEDYDRVLPIQPLVLLADGKIIVRCLDMLQIYDPRTNKFSHLLKTTHLSGIRQYTGNLLSLDGEN